MVPDRVDIAGVPLDCIGMGTAVARIIAAASRETHFQISTVNLDFLVNAQRDSAVREILQANALNVVDGAPVAWLARLAGAGPTERVAGADLVPLLVQEAARLGLRVFLLGGEGGAVSSAAARFADQHPGVVVGSYEPPRAALEDMDDEAILQQIRSFRPHLLFVAFGHPKQEKWIFRHRDELPLVAMGVGCSLDLVAGRCTRAPRLMQRLGLEWAYRLAREPARLARRYFNDAVWLATVVPLVALRRSRQAPLIPTPDRGSGMEPQLGPSLCTPEPDHQGEPFTPIGAAASPGSGLSHPLR